MARRPFGQILETVQVNVGFHSMWVEPTATTILTAVQREITEARQWSARKRVTLLQTVAPYTVGTVSATQGSPTITGSGTAWSSTMEGRAIALAGEYQYFFVALVTSPTSLSLADYNGTLVPWGKASQSAMPYRLFPIQYALPADLDVVLLPTRDWPVYPKTVEYFDRVDPMRTSQGRPHFYALSQQKQLAGLETFAIEFWPVPDLVYTIRFPYLRKGLTAMSPGDIPLCPTELVEMAGTIRAMRYLESKTGDQRWTRLSERYERELGELVQWCIHQDVERFGVPDALSQGEVVVGADDYQRRDWDLW
jgi:hypothetical protein